MTEKLIKILNDNTEKRETMVDDYCHKYYVSKIDGSYVGAIDQEKDLEFLADFGITEQIQNRKNINGNTSNIGFNPIEQKWYGWSHRAVYGFGIGSKVSKGDCAYQPKDLNDYIDEQLNFWKDKEYHDKTFYRLGKNEEGKEGFYIEWRYNDQVPNESLGYSISSIFYEIPSEFGRGEWVAETLEDAKQMACDFAGGVS
jgi:hypothetical protein